MLSLFLIIKILTWTWICIGYEIRPSLTTSRIGLKPFNRHFETTRIKLWVWEVSFMDLHMVGVSGFPL